MYASTGKRDTRRGRDIGELLFAQIREDDIGLWNRGAQTALSIHHVAAGGEQIFASIVIEVVNPVAPPGFRQRGVRNSARKSDLLEARPTQVAKQRHGLVEQCSFEDVREAVVVDVPGVHAHPRDSRAVFCERNAFFDCGLFERAVALVQEQAVRQRVV